jgi:hypothetical protein
MKLDPDPLTVFLEKTVPNGTRLAGWAALIHALAIPGPVRRPSCVSEQHVRGSHREEGAWAVFDKRYWPGDDFADHLSFALSHEDIDLLILKRIFEAVPQAEVETIVRAAPTGISARRAWYFYETLTGRTLDLEDAPRAAAIDVLDPKAYFTGKPHLSKRHREREVAALAGHGLGNDEIAEPLAAGPAMVQWASALLYNGLGRYEEALVAAQQASENPLEVLFSTWGLVELIEAAVRSGKPEPGGDALRRLSDHTRASGTDWALGVEARCRALLTEGEAAEALYREEIGRASCRERVY